MSSENFIRHRLDFSSAMGADSGCSEILIGPDLLGSGAAAAQLAPWLAGRTVFVLSTPRLRQLHGRLLEPIVRLAGRCVDLEVEDGEGAKSLAHAGRLWQEMLDAGGKRDSRLVTFGGGTVGDLGGFVAGCFLRGIEYVQLPTTLLAQVDASIGGKTAIDMDEAKNSVGLFHHPTAVLADTALLHTLSRGELRSGLMEAVKKGMVLDATLLGRIEDDLPSLLAGDRQALGPVVAAAAAAKCAVVEADTREGGWRRILNFGHTLGHAIETDLDFEHLRHGEAIAYGMLFALRLALARGLDRSAAERLEGLLRRVDLPPLPVLDADRLLHLMSKDKKATEQGLPWVLPTAVGQGDMFDDVSTGEVRAALAKFLHRPWS